MEVFRSWVDWHVWQLAAMSWILVCVLFISIGVVPRIPIFSKSYAEWRFDQRQIRGMRDWEVESASNKKRVRALGEELETLYVSIPGNDQISVILDCLRENSEGIGLSIRKIETDTPEFLEAYQERPIRLNAEGDFHALGSFVDRIERSPTLIKVTSIEISRAGNLSNGLSAVLSLRAVVLEK